MMNFNALGQQVDKYDEEQIVNVIDQLRANRGLLGPAIRMFAAKYGAAEWADIILSPETTREQLVRLFAIVKEEKENGPDAIRIAVANDPVTGPLVTRYTNS